MREGIKSLFLIEAIAKVGMVQHPLPLTPFHQWRGNIYQQI
jgi:hypothetical protein